MTPAEARDKLESVIWRERGGDSQRRASEVDAILAAADQYAAVTADEWLTAVERGHRRAEAAAAEIYRKDT
jgi:hypothetical protein